MRVTVRSTALLLTLAAAGLAAYLALSSSGNTSIASGASTAAAGELKGVCPATVVIQTDWYPESDHSESYAIAASNGQIDKKKQRYTAELMDGAVDTGVKVQIRAGGPAIGFQEPTQQMYEDNSIFLGYANTDTTIQFQSKQPMLSVMAPREGWPQIFLYDPKHYKFKTIADIGKTKATVLVFQGAAYVNYLVGKGYLKKSQVDDSYDGKPARFVASGGKDVQQGFITAEPWQYQHTVKQWAKPVATLLISKAGYPNYGEALAIKKGDLKKDTPCLKKLVPIIQKAQVAYAKNPAKTDALIAKIVATENVGWSYPAALAAYAAKAQTQYGIIADGPTPALGDFNLSRIQTMINILKPIYKAQHIKVDASLKPTDMYTNAFIDPKIGLGN